MENLRRTHPRKLAALMTVTLLVTAAWSTEVRASVASDTAAALATHPHGGPDLEAAILAILDSEAEGKAPQRIAEEVLTVVVREILSAKGGANEQQLVAIGRALATKARALAEADPAASRAISAAVTRVRVPALARSFNAGLGQRLPDLIVPSGAKGGLDTVSPS